MRSIKLHDHRLTDNWAQVWDLFEPRRLFRAHSGDGQYSGKDHVAQMISLLGPPPLDFIKSAPRAHLFWDEQGVGHGSSSSVALLTLWSRAIQGRRANPRQ